MSYVDCTPEELPEYEANECYFPKGGISKIAVLKTGHGITDFSNSTQVQAAIDAGNFVITGGLKAELPEPAVVEGENPVACGTETITDGYDYTVETSDFNVNEANDAFYAALNKSSFAGIVLYLCEQDKVRVVEQKISFNARLMIPLSNKEKQKYMITAKWYQDVTDPLPVLYDAPEGIFA